MIFEESYTLHNGAAIPKLALGTWFIDDDKAAEAVRAAVNIGYRHIDTAQAYGNERGVGEGIRTCGIDRKDIFVTSKVAAENKSYASAMESIEKTLETMGLAYLDMMIIHSPQPWVEVNQSKDRYYKENREVWRALEDALEAGKLRAIGVSNFLEGDLENIFAACRVKPMVNQILCHVGNSPLDLIDYCRKRDIVVEAYSPVAHGEALKGKIACGDPANSSSAFQVLMAMLYAKGKDGDPMSPEAWAYVDNFIKNVDGKFLNSSGAVHKGAADGEYTVGLTWEDPAATYVKNGAAVEVVFPKEGAIFPGESVQIIKGAKHMENAKKFVDFMLSQKIQEAAGKTLTVRPLRKGVKLADYMTPQDTIALFKNYDEGWVAAHKKEVVAEWNKHLENSRQ